MSANIFFREMYSNPLCWLDASIQLTYADCSVALAISDNDTSQAMTSYEMHPVCVGTLGSDRQARLKSVSNQEVLADPKRK